MPLRLDTIGKPQVRWEELAEHPGFVRGNGTIQGIPSAQIEFDIIRNDVDHTVSQAEWSFLPADKREWALEAYDVTFALLLDESQIDVLLPIRTSWQLMSEFKERVVFLVTASSVLVHRCWFILSAEYGKTSPNWQVFFFREPIVELASANWLTTSRVRG